MNWLATFSGAGYDKYLERTMPACGPAGIDQLRVYDEVWLQKHPFRNLPGNRWLWETEEKRGLGWHAWKALITLDTLDQAADGDVVLYLDGDTWPTGKDLRPLFDRARSEQIVLFDYSGHEPQSNWCTRNCFIVMGQDTPGFHQALHGCARFGFFLKGPWMPRQFLYEWLTYCLNPDANGRHLRTPLGPELPGFKEHRTDQAILTLLAHKYGLPLYPEASTLKAGYFVQCDGEGVVVSVPDDGHGSKWRNV